MPQRPEEQVIEEEATTTIPYRGTAIASPDDVLSMNEWVSMARQVVDKDGKKVNESFSDEDLREYWADNYADEWIRRKGDEESIGYSGTLKEGVKAAGRALGSAFHNVIGSPEYIEEARKESLRAKEDPALRDFNTYIYEQWQKVKADPRQKFLTSIAPGVVGGVVDEGIKAVGVLGRAVKEKGRTPVGLFMTSQIGNQAASLAPAISGAGLGWRIGGPRGALFGGIIGNFIGSSGIEMGYESMRLAEDGLTPEEMVQARKYGLTKGAVITAVDTGTFGVSKWLLNTTSRAVPAAVRKVLKDEGVDISNPSAMMAHSKNPILKAKARNAAETAVSMSNQLYRRLPRLGMAFSTQVLGEGVGEYLGEAAASGNPDMMDAVLEAFAGFGHSAVEMGIAGKLRPKADPFVAAGIGDPSVSIEEVTSRLSVEPDNLYQYMEDISTLALSGDPTQVTVPAGFIAPDDPGGVRSFTGTPSENRRSLIDLYDQLEGSGIVSGLERGVEAFSDGNFAEAAPLIERAANVGHVGAQDFLGEMYAGGVGVIENLDKSIEFLRKSVQRGKPDSYAKLADVMRRKINEGADQEVLLSDPIMPENMPEERQSYIQVLTEGAEKGDARALYNLGVVHESGHGVNVDEEIAASFYRKAEKAGIVDAGRRAAAIEGSKGTRANWQSAYARYEAAPAGPEKRAALIESLEAELRYRKNAASKMGEQLSNETKRREALVKERPEDSASIEAIDKKIGSTRKLFESRNDRVDKTNQRLKSLRGIPDPTAEDAAAGYQEMDIDRVQDIIRRGEPAYSKRNVDLAHLRLAARAMQRATPEQLSKIQRLIESVGDSQSVLDAIDDNTYSGVLSPVEAASNHRSILEGLREAFDDVWGKLPKEGAVEEKIEITPDIDRISESAGGLGKLTEEFEAVSVTDAPAAAAAPKSTDEAVAEAIASLTGSMNEILSSVGQAAAGEAAAEGAPPGAPPISEDPPVPSGQQPPRRGTEATPTTELNLLEKVRIAVVDKSMPMHELVLRLQNAGRTVPDEVNPIYYDEQWAARVQDQERATVRNFLNPLWSLAKPFRLKSWDVLNKILHAKHILGDKVNAYYKKINPEGGDSQGGMSDAEAMEVLGINAEGVVVNQEAATMVEKLSPLVDIVKALIRDNQRLLVKYGLESQETVDSWNETYQDWVPLSREFTETGEQIGDRSGSHGGSAGPVRSRERVGTMKDRSVLNIIHQLIFRRMKIITSGEQNRVRQALAGHLAMFPDENFATVHIPKQTKYTDAEGLDAAAAADDGGTAIPMKTKLNKEGKREDYPDPNYVRRADVVNFWVGGQPRQIIFNKNNPRSMVTANAFNVEPTKDLGWFLSHVGSGTKFIGSMSTQYSPSFGVTNFGRDVIIAPIQLMATELKGKTFAIWKNIPKNMWSVWRDGRALRKGNPLPSDSLLLKYSEAGGLVGYADLFGNFDKTMELIQEKLAGRSIGRKTWNAIKEGTFRLLSDFTQTLETSVRLAVFEEGKKAGMSDMKAANHAKNATVNFSKKGTITRQMGALYAFFNASSQSTDMLARTMFRYPPGEYGNLTKAELAPAGRKMVAGGLLFGMIGAYMLAKAGYGDDDFQEWEKSRSLIVPLGDGKVYKHPLPLGPNTIVNAGRLGMEAFLYGNAKEKVNYWLEDSVDIFSPVGGAATLQQWLTPTVLDPIFDVATNKTWFGGEISKEDFPGSMETPGYTRVKGERRDFVSLFVSPAISKFINDWTGGDAVTPGAFSPTPNDVEYLIAVGAGGIGRDIRKADRIRRDYMAGRPIDVGQLPLAGRFAKDTLALRSVKQRFYTSARKAQSAADRVDAFLKLRSESNDPDEKAAFFKKANGIKKNHPEWVMGEYAKEAMKDNASWAKSIREEEARIEVAGGPDRLRRGRVGVLEERMRGLMERFIDDYDRRMDEVRGD